MLHRSLLIFLAMSPVATSAADVEHRFVRIFEPREEDKYSTGANVASVGYFYFLDREWKPEDLRIRVRIYRSADGGFELFQEQDAEIGHSLPREPATLQYGITVKPKKAPKPGIYLFRVDCLDTTGKEEQLLASNSVFLTFVEVRKNNEPEVQASKPRSARINRVSRISRRSR
jgi:hypothetical protein